MSLRLVGSLMILTAALPGQTQVDLYNQVKGSTKPVKIGSTLPATCRAGDLFLHTAVAGGQNVFACISDNIWVPQGGGSLTIQGDGVAVGTESIQNFMAGFGIVKTLSNIDSRVDIGYTIDSAVVQTHEVAQSGRDLYCPSASDSASAYTCNLTPSLSSYQSGMVIFWKPDVDTSGSAITLSINGLTARSVTMADGVTVPQSSDVAAGKLIPVWFDGSVFRIVVADGQPAIGTRPSCSPILKGRIWYTAAASGVKDDVAICAKDADNAYAWRMVY